MFSHKRLVKMISEWILILTVCPRGCTRCCKYTTFSETRQIPPRAPTAQRRVLNSASENWLSEMGKFMCLTRKIIRDFGKFMSLVRKIMCLVVKRVSEVKKWEVVSGVRTPLFSRFMSGCTKKEGAVPNLMRHSPLGCKALFRTRL
jgi:hypothetical protein